MPAPSLADATAVVTNNGLRTQYGLILPPGARVAAYVRSSGVQSSDDAFLAQNLVTSLAAGLARVRPGFGDFVVCLPGHAENVVDATTFSSALVSGAKIVGVGRGANMPTFTFTAVGASWAVSTASISVTGVRLVGNSAGGVTNMVNVTAADFGFYFNEINLVVGLVSNVVILNAGADRADLSGNVLRGMGGTTTNGFALGAVDNCRIADNELLAPSGTNTGLIAALGVSTSLKVLRNVINNYTAGSVAGISFPNNANTGHCAYNTITVLSTGAAVSGTTGITIGAACLVGFFQNYVVNDPLKSGLLMPTVDT